MELNKADQAPGKREKHKIILSVLRFLAGAGTHGAIHDQNEDYFTRTASASKQSAEQQLRLVRGDGRKLPVTKQTLAHLIQIGAVTCHDQVCHLSREGRSALKRLLSGDGENYGNQHRDLDWRDDNDNGQVQVNLDESPLGGLSRLKQRDGSIWFPRELIAAGDRLRADFTRGHYLPGMGVRFDAFGGRDSTARGAGIAELTDAAMAARIRMEKALAAVGPELAGPLVDVCCYLKGLEMVESERQWPRRSAKLMLRAGLERLARHYAPPPRNPTECSRSWGADGYRPELSGRRAIHGQ